MSNEDMKNELKTLFVAAAFAALGSGVAAEGVKASLSAYEMAEVFSSDGVKTVQYSGLEDVVPGDRVQYRMSVANEGTEPASNLSFEMQIAASTVINMNSFDGDENFSLAFSTSQAPEHFAAFESLTVENNLGEISPAKAEDLAAIQVNLTGLEVGADLEMKYVVVVR